MTEEKKPDIWTPKEKLDTNVQRMAWLLFQAQWKGYVTAHYLSADMVAFNVSDVYANCLRSAKEIRNLEVEAGG